MTYITVYSGEKIDLLFPDKDKIHLKDIIHALSNICRYTGHTPRFYSVGQHSLIGTNLILEYMNRLVEPEDIYETAYMFLMHDAQEAYVGDVSSPLKNLISKMPDNPKDFSNTDAMIRYDDLEKRFEKTIHEKYVLPLVGKRKYTKLLKIVQYADRAMYDLEIEYFQGTQRPKYTDWLPPITAFDNILLSSPNSVEVMFETKRQKLVASIKEHSVP